MRCSIALAVLLSACAHVHVPSVGEGVEMNCAGAVLPRFSPWCDDVVAETGVDGTSARGDRMFFTTRKDGFRYYENDVNQTWRFKRFWRFW